MRRLTLLLSWLLLLSLVLAACGGGGQQGAGGDDAVARGKALYEKTVIGPNSAPGCITCHALEPDKVIVGPSHAHIATIAETAVPGMSAAEYLRESIVNPDAHITAGFPAGVMYQNYGKDLTEQEINDRVAFLLTLK
ncbi:MAG: c-type cytochrome [Caldilineales bacterium]|nr:c-type cytochrome [Caldilineales bacterium]